MASTVIDADSPDWSLTGDIRLTTRDVIAQWCPPAAGTEKDPILLTNNATSELPQLTLRFQAAAIIAYGAMFGDLNGLISRGIDGAARSDAIPAAEIAAAEGVSAAGDVACGIVLARSDNLKTGVKHRFDIAPMGKVEFAIYRVELYQEPIVTTVTQRIISTSTMSNSSPASLIEASNTVPATESSERSGPVSSMGAIRAPSSSSVPIAAVIVSIFGVLVLFALLALFLCRRRRRRRVPPDSIIDIYQYATQTNDAPRPEAFIAAVGGKASLSSGDDKQPYAITSRPSSGDPYTHTGTKIHLLHVSSAKERRVHGQIPTSGSGAQATGQSVVAVDLDVPLSRPLGGDAVQMAALSEAMKRAGFSPEALLESLNRVHARANDDIDVATPTTETKMRPPQYRE